jgi:hypothetical protein
MNWLTVTGLVEMWLSTECGNFNPGLLHASFSSHTTVSFKLKYLQQSFNKSVHHEHGMLFVSTQKLFKEVKI